MVQTLDFPQADKLEQVGDTVIAVANGKHTDLEIEESLGLNSLGRQGRYYRPAAVNLGLIVNTKNFAELTHLGREYIQLTSQRSRLDFLARCLVDAPVFKEGLQYIHKYSPDTPKLKLWFQHFYPGAKSTATRRFSTFISYLKDTELVEVVGGIYRVTKYTGRVVTIREGSVLAGDAARARREPAVSPSILDTIYQVDRQKADRANHTHWRLVEAKSLWLHAAGLQPCENKHIDLYASQKHRVILYEMKSLNKDVSNFISQMRRAISQLYEYRYLFNCPHAILSLVTSARIPQSRKWVLDYLARDRSIAYEWTDDFKNFEASQSSREILDQFFL